MRVTIQTKQKYEAVWTTLCWFFFCLRLIIYVLVECLALNYDVVCREEADDAMPVARGVDYLVATEVELAGAQRLLARSVGDLSDLATLGSMVTGLLVAPILRTPIPRSRDLPY